VTTKQQEQEQEQAQQAEQAIFRNTFKPVFSRTKIPRLATVQKRVTFCNKIFSGYQPRQMVEWRKNQRFEDHFRPRPQGTEVAGVHICVIHIPARAPDSRTRMEMVLQMLDFAIETFDAAGSPRRFYYT
jgi:hypothetical protein